MIFWIFIIIALMNDLDYSRILQPHNGFGGLWSDYADSTCNYTFLNSVSIQILDKYKVSCPLCSDSRGATNLRMKCSDGEEFEGYTRVNR